MAITQLGYLGFEVKDPGAWRTFLFEVLGLMPAEESGGEGFAARNDGFAQRFLVTPGAADDLSVLGWVVESEVALEALAARLRERGVAVEEAPEELRRARKVERLLRYTDPSGIPSELCVGLGRAATPFASALVPAGFVAEEAGCGHLVLSQSSQAEGKAFYQELLGFRLSDHIRCEVHGFPVDLAFFHVNRRHHTLAFGDRQRKRLHHFMVEARTMDDVGLCFDRTLRAGLPIMQTLGRHPNDRMFSFYAKTPSGFQFEFGWGGREVDDATWVPGEYGAISEWGHHPPQFLAPPPRR